MYIHVEDQKSPGTYVNQFVRGLSWINSTENRNEGYLASGVYAGIVGITCTNLEPCDSRLGGNSATERRVNINIRAHMAPVTCVQWNTRFGYLTTVDEKGSVFLWKRMENDQWTIQLLCRMDSKTSLVLFPEGTRFHPSKTRDIAKSRQLAIEAGVTPPEKTLLPRFRGMHLTVDTLGDTFDAVYDVTIVYERAGQQGEQALLAPGLYDVLCGPAYYKVHAHVDRIPMSVVPREEQSLQRWLYDRFSIKDRAFRNFLTDGRPFAEEPIACKRVSFADTLPSALLLSAATIALLCTAKGRRLFVRVWALGSLACLVDMKLRRAA